MFALVDCNNFYVSCERMFNPMLRGVPVVVLSNNDGCIVSRSNEAKRLGVGMGQPLFEIESLVRQHDVRVYSSNYTLYGDMSRRVMTVLREFAPEIEVYSIDEAFLMLSEWPPQDPQEHCHQMRATVQQHTGIPVSVGWAPTKTLAKVAARFAKRSSGVCCLTVDESLSERLRGVDVADIWGIGRKKAEWLKRQGVLNAAQLRDAPDDWLRKNLTVTGLRTACELRGVSCLPLERVPPPKQAIGVSRSFRRLVRSVDELEEALATYVGRAAEKLREQHRIAGYLQVFIRGNPFRKDWPYYANAAGCAITPTAYTPDMVKVARQLLRHIYRCDTIYKKAGVLLTDLSPMANEQHQLFDEEYSTGARARLMDAVDEINKSSGVKIQLASEGFKKPWFMRQSMKSQRYTTRWDEVLDVHIGTAAGDSGRSPSPRPRRKEKT
jgi:DNA polymerase V